MLRVHVLILGDFHLFCLGTRAYYGNSHTRTGLRAWSCEYKNTRALACPFHGEDLIKVGYAGAIVTFGGAKSTAVNDRPGPKARKSIYAFTLRIQNLSESIHGDQCKTPMHSALESPAATQISPRYLTKHNAKHINLSNAPYFFRMRVSPYICSIPEPFVHSFKQIVLPSSLLL